MTITRNAGLYDLRFMFAEVQPRFGMPAGESEEEQNEDTPPSDTDSPSVPADDTDDQDDESSEDEVRHPRIKQLSDEAKRHRHAAKQERDRADNEKQRADGLQERVSTLILENAFIKTAVGRVSDFDAALKLMDRTGITITPEGEVTGIDEALAKVIERYPYVADDDAPAHTDLNAALAGLQASGRPHNGKRQPIAGGTPAKVLRAKFPALGTRR